MNSASGSPPSAAIPPSTRVSIEPWNPRKPAFRAHAFHHAVALDALRDAPVAPVLAALAEAIKPGGQLVLQELVAHAPLDPDDPAVAAWCRLEGHSAALPTEAVVTQELQRLRFDIRVLEDQSDRHAGLIVQGWQELVDWMQAAHPGRAEAQAMVDEAELWARYIGLLQAGSIRLLRWHAFAPAAAGAR